MSQMCTETFDLFMYMQFVLVFLWIGISLIYYVFKMVKKSWNLPSHPQLPSKKLEPTKKIKKETLLSSDFNPISSSTPLPEVNDVVKADTWKFDSIHQNSTCNPGKMTINPWLNFVRHFRTSYCSIRRQSELLHRAGEVWRNMSDTQKEPFRLQAEQVQSMRVSKIASDQN